MNIFALLSNCQYVYHLQPAHLAPYQSFQLQRQALPESSGDGGVGAGGGTVVSAMVGAVGVKVRV